MFLISFDLFFRSVSKPLYFFLSLYLLISLSLSLWPNVCFFFVIHNCYVCMHVQVTALKLMFHFLRFYSLFLYLRSLSRYLAISLSCLSVSPSLCFSVSLSVSVSFHFSFSIFLFLLFFLCFCLSISLLFWTLYYSTWSIKWRMLKASPFW